MLVKCALFSRAAVSCIVGATLFLLSAAAGAEIQFEDVSSEVGLNRIQPSFGQAWGDLNSDGWPDLFINNHSRKNSIYLNSGNGNFRDVTDAADGDNFWTDVGQDTHGGTWADYDNDGYADFAVQMRRGQYFLFHNNGDSTFTELGGSVGIDQAPRSFQRDGKNVVWIDHDMDGDQDLYFAGIGEHDFFENLGDGTRYMRRYTNMYKLIQIYTNVYSYA